MTNRKMFFTMLWGAVFRRRSRAMMAVIASLVGAATLFCLASVCVAVPQQMNEEMRAYGANLIVTPASATGKSQGIDTATVRNVTALIGAGHSVKSAAYRYESVRINSAPYTIAGVDVKAVRALNRHWNVTGDWPGADNVMVLNGGYVFAGKDDVIYKHSIPDKDIEALVRYQEKEGEFPCAFVQEDEIFMNYTDKAVNDVFHLLNFPAPPIRPIEDIYGKTVYQLIAFFTAEQEKRIMKVLSHCESTRWNPLFTDIVPLGSSKRVGIDKMLEHYHIGLDECMAFGDGGNDIQMLSHVGIGVAMGNAAEDVMSAAGYVTTSVDENGVYNALKHFNII